MLKCKKKKLVLLGSSLLFFTLLFLGCSEETNQAPVIESLSKSTSELEATLTGSVTDSDGSISKVEIVWGDENNDTVSSGFNSIDESHIYDNDGSYDVTVTAIDDDGKNTSQTISVTVEETNPGEMVTVPAGTAADGSTSINFDIAMGKYEVTHAEFIQFLNSAGVASDGSYEGKEVIDMGDNDCAVDHDGSFYFAGSDVADSEDTPVIYVSWYGAVAYCNWLSKQEGLNPAYDLNNWELKNSDESTLEGYRLPTETEWEYAARGGANGNNTTYAGSNNIDDVAWYSRNSGDQYLDGGWDASKIESNNCRTHPVGEKQSNELGIYDMSGNVWEWTNTQDSSMRGLNGGSWYHSDINCEVSYRITNGSSFSSNYVGFRLAKTK